MERVAKQGPPDREVQQAEAHNRHAHDRAGREGHAETRIEAVLRGVCRPAVGPGGYRHSDEAGKPGEKPSRDEGEGNEGRDEVEDKGERSEQDEKGDEHEADNGVLLLQVGHGAFLNRLADLFHGLRARVFSEHGNGLIESEKECHDRPHPCQPHHVDLASAAAALGERSGQGEEDENRCEHDELLLAVHRGFILLHVA